MGPTASGKSDIAIALARKYDGEIISADSRQVYKGMDVGSGKVSKTEQRLARHWLLDVASPKRSYNVTHFVRDAKKIIKDIERRHKTPIICGGTGFWIQTLIENNAFPAVRPDIHLRGKLMKLSTERLFKQLEKKDKERAKTIDPHNKIRLVRALEIISQLGKVPRIEKMNEQSDSDEYIIFVLNPPKDILDKKIEVRLDKRLRKGMLAEVKKLKESGLSWKKLESFGLEYKYLSLFLQKKISKEEMKERLNFEIRHFAKRQLTWIRRFEKQGAKIHWINDAKNVPSILTKFM